MKNKLLRIGIILSLLGVAANVAVAWACAMWSEQDAWLDQETFDPPAVWPTYLQTLSWPAPDHAIQRTGLGWGVRRQEITGGMVNTDPEANTGWTSLEIRQFGFPHRGLQWEAHGAVGAAANQAIEAAQAAAGWRTGIDVWGSATSFEDVARRRLPLTPTWPGFLINTLFYAAAFALPVMLLRKR